MAAICHVVFIVGVFGPTTNNGWVFTVAQNLAGIAAVVSIKGKFITLAVWLENAYSCSFWGFLAFDLVNG